jgi:oxygen-independent coproporphyrinogen-3 oxidase
MDHDAVAVTPEILRRYDQPGPRYTSYPTAPEWSPDFGADQYAEALVRSNSCKEPLSLYVHIPFCDKRCAFCGCNVVASTKDSAMEKYLDYVHREIALVAEALGKRNHLAQIHWGGGTPTSLRADQLQHLFTSIADHFAIEKGAEIAIEVDPRVTSLEQLNMLRVLGFNRLSLGVQDFDEVVQREIQRNQTEKQTRQLMSWGRAAGFEGINVDLIYGLPGQTMSSWIETIKKVVEIEPDRLAIYSYAHMPDRLRNQRAIDASKLPDPETKYALFAVGRQALIDAGYHAIAMDHFALPHDDLSLAMETRTLHRNFMGYTVVRAQDSIGIGVSSIGEIAGAYAQNEKKLSKYYEAIDAGHLATSGGCVLSKDDEIRRWVIRQLMCNFHVEYRDVENRFGVRFDEYFRDEQAELQRFEDEGLLDCVEGGIVVQPLGQVFIRNIAMVFDAYLRRVDGKRAFSRTV